MFDGSLDGLADSITLIITYFYVDDLISEHAGDPPWMKSGSDAVG